MATVRGRSEVKRFIARLPAELEKKVLRGAARAAATVVADEARDRVISDEVRENIVTKSRAEPGRITVKISVKPGWARSVGIWLEYGTAPHFITVDDSQREGMSANRINRLDKEAAKTGGSLVINGRFVGATVHHPGTEAKPFLRVALDFKQAEAIAAAQSFINSRVGPSGIVGSAEPESDDA